MGVFVIIENCIIMLILFLSGFFMQNINNINKKSVFYGVRIPIGYEKNEKMIRLHKEFRRNFTVSFAVLSIVLGVLIECMSNEIAVLLAIPGTFIGLALIYINFWIINKKVKQIKKSEEWSFESKNVVVVDTSFRKKDEASKKTVISAWWFLIPFTIMTITVTYILMNTKTISANIAGQGDFIVLSPFIIQALLNLIFYCVYKWTEKAKQSLNGGKVGEIKSKSRRMRYYLSVCYLLFDIYSNLLIMVVGLSLLELISTSLISSIGFTIISVLAPIIIVLIVVLAAFKDSKKITATTDGVEEQLVINRDDDEYYKFGAIYYNKNDPALFVEKRTGIGTTMNFARPAAKISMSILAAIIVIPLTLMFVFMPGMTKERQIDIKAKSITISGTWGTEISKEQISKVGLENKLPKVITRTNGANIGNKLFGHFKLEGYKNSLLYLGECTKSFVAIYQKDGKLVLINYEDESKTESLYNNIISTMGIK